MMIYLVAAALMLLTACGEDTQRDDLPNWLTGVSGVIIACVVLYLIYRAVKRSKK